MAVGLLATSACDGGRDDDLQLAVLSRDSAFQGAAMQAGGEVAANLGTDHVLGRWLGDDNVLALMGLFNARQIAAADAELRLWDSDLVRALAEQMARDHAAMQHSADSLAGRMHVTAVPPALGQQIDSTLREQLDELADKRGRALDRSYVGEQVATHRMMIDYFQKFGAVAERRELVTLLDSQTVRLNAHLARARALQESFARADSARSDSASRRSRLPRQ